MTLQEELDPEFEALLEYLYRSRGLDFSGYKRSSLKRLTNKRMQRVEVATYSDYLDYLQVHPIEHNYLFNSLLLNVTSFFRDREAWEQLAETVIPRILQQKEEGEMIRCWCAGCASGEEAYTLAILLCEALGPEQFRHRVKIYATDLDEEALVRGRQALYCARSLQAVPEDYRDRYFEDTGTHWMFRSDLRRAIIFGRHDLVQDAPISRLELLTCRNTLMYFNVETQARVIDRFHFALNNDGFLFVGKAEMLLGQVSLFNPVSLKFRVFTKVAKVNWRDRLALTNSVSSFRSANFFVSSLRLRDEAFDASPVPHIVTDAQYNLALANRKARSLFNLQSQYLGRPLRELELYHHPARLEPAIEVACTTRSPIVLSDILLEVDEEQHLYLEIHILPIVEGTGGIIGVNIVFIDVSQYHNLREELARSTQELETAYEELQTFNEELETTNEELQSTNEELQSTNEELQSTNEELQTTNEELQSTNEELETMNEELQSSNDELQIANEQLRAKSNELNRITVFVESILTSLKMGMAVLDTRFSVQLWNSRMTELWGLRSEEVQGFFFFDLDFNLPVELLRTPIRACQNESSDYEEILVPSLDRRGRPIHCRIICMPLKIENQLEGVILLMEEQDGTDEAS